MLYDTDQRDRPQMRRLAQDTVHFVPASEHWRVLQLRSVDAKRLNQKLRACISRYEKSAGGQNYLVHVALARRPSQG